MKVTKGNPWGNVTGKMSTTPAQALRMFNFVQDPTAKGIIFKRYNYTDESGREYHGTHIANYFPPGNPQSPSQMSARRKFQYITTITCLHAKDLIEPIWGPYSKKHDLANGHGQNLFRSINMRCIKDLCNLDRMLISFGDLEPIEKISEAKYLKDDCYYIEWCPKTTKNGTGTDKIQIAVLDIETRCLQILKTKPGIKREDREAFGYGNPPERNFIVYIFANNGTDYSKSTSYIVEREDDMRRATMQPMIHGTTSTAVTPLNIIGRGRLLSYYLKWTETAGTTCTRITIDGNVFSVDDCAFWDDSKIQALQNLMPIEDNEGMFIPQGTSEGNSNNFQGIDFAKSLKIVLDKMTQEIEYWIFYSLEECCC